MNVASSYRPRIEADPEQVEKIVSWETPSCPDDVRRFLGFIKDFYRIARPLTDMMPTPEKKKGRGKQTRPNGSWKWG